jgi:putative hydrolase of the HAD superfamily|tara:strand:- start:1138 stop:1794 length:657 start_codon:yes stop_codon:yes gene_type:complete
MINNRFSSIFWDFGGVLTSSPFEAFNIYEKSSGLPKDFIRKVNSTNSEKNAWALLEQSKISLEEFDSLFAKESNELGHKVNGADVLELLQGEIRPEMISVLKLLKEKGFQQACLTNNFDSGDKDISPLDDANEDRAKIMNIFDFIIESKDVGVRKPDFDFYKISLEKTKANPKNIIFLDDLGINLKTAKSMGMTTIKVLTPSQAINDLEKTLGISLKV